MKTANDALSQHPAPRLHARGLVKTYQAHGVQQNVLSGLELSLGAGEIVVLQGPSGEGKSTLLHLLAGLERPDQGQIWLNDEDLAQADEARLCQLRRESVGLVFQFFNLVPTLTVLENLQLALALCGGEARQADIERLLAEVGLTHKTDMFPQQLSGGEQQRIAIVRTLLQQPQLILADEPTGNLDRNNAERVMTLFVDQVRQREGTLLLATHDPSLTALADRCLRLENGQLYHD